MSYGGQLHFGVLADRDLVPDVERIAGYLADELELLHKVVVETQYARSRLMSQPPSVAGADRR